MMEYLSGYVGHYIGGNKDCEVVFDLDGEVLETEDGQVNIVPVTLWQDGKDAAILQLTYGDVIALKRILSRCEEILDGMGYEDALHGEVESK